MDFRIRAVLLLPSTRQAKQHTIVVKLLALNEEILNQ